MRSKADAQLPDVRITSELKRTFDEHFFELKGQVLRRAALHAANRMTLGAASLISPDDLVAAAEEAFAEAADRLNQAIASRGATHVRRAS